MIIGLAGYAGSGKDSVAEYLVSNHGFDRVAFADPIKNVLYDTNPMLAHGYTLQTVVEKFGWESAKRATPGVRELQQNLGAAMRKHISADVFVDIVREGVEFVESKFVDVVISDVRMPNEAAMVKNLGGHLVWVTRTGVGPANDDISENALDDVVFDYFLNNFRSLSVLGQLTEQMIYKLCRLELPAVVTERDDD